jgi:ATP-dependent exoDNAse (exonuclease V) beta subunit
VLPASLRDALVAGRDVEWHASSGQRHRLRSCPEQRQDEAASAPVESSNPDGASGTETASDYLPLVDQAPARRPVGELIAAPSISPPPAAADADRLAGILVHRLVQRLGLAAGPTPTADIVLPLLRPDERLEASEGVVQLALNAYAALGRHEDVRSLYLAGEVLHEVPFTMRADAGGWVRGTIDCIVRDGGRVTVLEFKTGRRRPEHQAQADLYARAAAHLFPRHDIVSRVVYSHEVAAT